MDSAREAPAASAGTGKEAPPTRSASADVRETAGMSIARHYADRFKRKAPGEGEERSSVGMEAKFCLTDSTGDAVPAELLEDMFDHLAGECWEQIRDRKLDVATGARKESATCPAVISTGTGHCKIEFSVPYSSSLKGLESNFRDMVEPVRSFIQDRDAHLLCLGVHPRTEPGPWMVQKKVRHVFWDHVFPSGLVHLFAICSDCQVHVDVGPEDLHTAVNVFQGFAGPQIALTANATVWKGGVDEEYVDLREVFWDWWLQGEDRAGMAARPFSSLEDYAGHISSMRPVFVMREGESLGIYGYPSFLEYYASGDGAKAVTADGDEVGVVPGEGDIDLHDTFNWYTCRLSRYGTVENRANCQQPPEDVMAVPALTLGLVENLRESGRFIDSLDWEFLRQCRTAAVREGPAAVVGDQKVLELSREMLRLAGEGLIRRGDGEERYLAPLWGRLEEKTCPAIEVRERCRRGGIDTLIERYSL